MGVPGLKSWVVKNCPTARIDFQAKHPGCKYIAVDAIGFVYFLYTFDWLHGGQYAAFEKQLARYIHALNSVQVSPVFFFDGKCDPRKLETFIDRFYQRENESKEIYKSLQEHESTSFKILPYCLIDHLRSYLAKTNVKIHQAEFEADVEIARFCKINAEACFGVWTNDSDMLVYDGIENVVFFDDIQLVDNSICCRFYNQKKVLANLGIPKYALATLVSLAGNDYFKSTEQIRTAVSKFLRRKLNNSTSKTTRISLFCAFLKRLIPKKSGNDLDFSVALITKTPIMIFNNTRSHYCLDDEDLSYAAKVRIPLYSDLFEFPVHDVILPLRHYYYKSIFPEMEVEEYYFERSKLMTRIISSDTVIGFPACDLLQYLDKSCKTVTMAVKILKTLVTKTNITIFDWEWDFFLDNVNICRDNDNDDDLGTDNHGTCFFRYRSLFVMLQLGIHYCHSIIQSSRKHDVDDLDYKQFDGIKYYKRYRIAYNLHA